MSDLSKLPKWAQDEMRKLQRQRDEAVAELNAWSDHQTPQPISVDELSCVETPPKSYTRYVEGNRVHISHLGVEVDIYLRGDCIDLKYDAGRHLGHRALLVPVSFQAFEIRPITEKDINAVRVK